MEKNTNKKLFAGVLALSCAFILSACDPVTSIPAGYNDPILSYTDGKEVNTSDNYLGKIYDSISGNKNDKVLQQILDEIIDEKFGKYEDIVAAAESNTAKLNYVKEHKDMFVKKDDTDALQIARFDSFKADIDKRISEHFYSLITSGSYNDPVTGMFDEEKLYTSLSEQLYDLKAKPSKFKKFYVTAELKKEEAFESLTKELYSYSEDEEIANLPEGVTYKANGYINNKVIPQILKDKFVENYIYDNNYKSLGRAYAREVNYVKIPWTLKSLSYVDYVKNEYVKDFVYKAIENAGAENDTTKLEFDVIGKTMLGFEGLNTEENGPLVKVSNSGSLYTTAWAETVNKNYYDSITDVNLKKNMVSVKAESKPQYFKTLDGMTIFDKDFTVYPDTKLGELLDSYNKAIRAKEAGLFPLDTDKTELEKFSGKSLADSLRTKILELAKEDNSTGGWYVKNGGISDLPSPLRDRLFNINVANDLDVDYASVNKGGFVLETITQESENVGAYRYDRNGNLLEKMPYCRNINGRKFIMPAEKADPFTENKNNFIYNDGSAYYICQVLQAPSTSKLDDSSTSAYKDSSNKVDVAKIQSYARTIATILSTKDTYVSSAYTEYLEKYSFEFYDTNLYDYFKSQYPDLFDEEE